MTAPAAPPDPVLYEAGGRGCTVPGCGDRHLARGYCRPHYVRWQRHGDPQAAVPVLRRVRGALTYSSAHRRVRADRGPASAQRCTECHGPAVLWSYDGTDPAEHTDPGQSRRYSTDPDRYQPRCRSCHHRANPGRRRRAAAAIEVDVERATRLYRAGASARGIGALLHVRRDVVLGALRAHGVAIRPSGHHR